jgi:hypothetical protein
MVTAAIFCGGFRWWCNNTEGSYRFFGTPSPSTSPVVYVYYLGAGLMMLMAVHNKGVYRMRGNTEWQRDGGRKGVQNEGMRCIEEGGGVQNERGGGGVQNERGYRIREGGKGEAHNERGEEAVYRIRGMVGESR